MFESKFDQTADRNHVNFFQYAQTYDLPDFVKAASTEDTFPVEKLPSGAYADIRVPYQFPCHTKAATYVSYMYFLNNQERILPKFRDKIAARLNDFADKWGIPNAIKKLQTKHASAIKDITYTLPDEAFAYVGLIDGVKERHYPMKSAAEVKVAAEWFIKYRDQFSFNDRFDMANKILDRATKLGAALGETEDNLEKHAGRGFGSPTKIAEMLRNRMRATENIPELKAGFQKLAESVESNPQLALDQSVLRGLAGVVDTYDKIAHVNYTPVTPRVEDVLFEVSFKAATATVDDTCTTLTGSVFGRNQFEKLSLTDVRDFFGDDIAQSVCHGLAVDPDKMAEVAETLPRPDAELFDRLMKNAGQSPVYKKASVDPNRMSLSQWVSVAD